MYSQIEERGRSDAAIGDWKGLERASDEAGAIPTPDVARLIRIGGIEILPCARSVLVDGQAVTLGSRAYDVLLTLVQSRGQVVSKEVIMRQVWPTTTVEEINLRVQLSCLRRSLGHERWRIKTIPGRGYMLAIDDPAESVTLAVEPAWHDTTEAPIVIIATDNGNRERLRQMLSTVGARVESFASLTAYLARGKTDGTEQANRTLAQTPCAL